MNTLIGSIYRCRTPLQNVHKPEKKKTMNKWARWLYLMPHTPATVCTRVTFNNNKCQKMISKCICSCARAGAGDIEWIVTKLRKEWKRNFCFNYVRVRYVYNFCFPVALEKCYHYAVTFFKYMFTSIQSYIVYLCMRVAEYCRQIIFYH